MPTFFRSTTFTQTQRDYIAGQRLGRLATIDANGNPQNNPVGFRLNTELGTIDIGGHGMGNSKKFRNVLANPKVAFVVDDVATEPRQVRFVEIRGTAEQVTGEEPIFPGQDPEFIRVHPTLIISFGLGED
ncbi:MAG TPA: PPOX class F420-dependent oxidoreductase [Thermomicrobiales bacterium]|nr:PPOX class F420-dependent oxidoreductase [Thermomicrobiales bacterium]